MKRLTIVSLVFVLAVASAFTTKAKFNVTVYQNPNCTSVVLSSLPSHCVTSAQSTYCTTSNTSVTAASIYQDAITCVAPYYYQ